MKNNWLIKKIKTYKDKKISRNKKMEKNNLESIEYLNDCYWRGISISTSKEGLQFRLQNPQIDFHKCRFECPIYSGETCCDSYFPLSKLNFISILQ